jgi:hypothetical protein
MYKRLKCRAGATFLASCLALAASNPVEAQVAASGMLLSPSVHRGEVFAWRATLTQRIPSSSSRGTVVVIDRQIMNVSCSVLSGSASAFIVSRHLDVSDTIPARQLVPPPDLVSAMRAQGLDVKPLPASTDDPRIIIRRGAEFDVFGPPLNKDPICQFYSATLYGIPSGGLRVGTTWSYHQPMDFRKHCERLPSDPAEHCLSDSEQVKVSVTSLDAKHNRVGLHIVTSTSNDSKAYCIIDMTVIDGGVIQQSIDRYRNSARRGQPPDSVVWSLLRS